AGIWALSQIRSQYFPDIVVESVTVQIAWDGAGAHDVDTAIVAVLEPVLRAVEGADEVVSIAREGGARIAVSFEPGTDMARATDDVKAAVDNVRTLPETAEDPVIRQAGWRDLVTEVVISGPVGADQLTLLADEFVARLFQAGITRTSVRGVSDPRITIAVTEAAMMRHDVTLAEIAAAVAAEAEVHPAGDMAESAMRVRMGEAKRTAEEIAGATLRTRPDGSRLLVRDVAEITLEGPETRIAYFVGDDPAVAIRVDRNDQGDAIAIQKTVARLADEMRLTAPRDVRIELVRSRAEAIIDRLALLIDNGLTGLAFVLLLLFLFLDARTAFWVAAGIPTAMLAALGLMQVFGLTLNMVSLFALILCLGIVVDDAIVVGEHADHLHRYRGFSPERAAIRGATRMAAPVIASSLTTIIAFASLTLIGGRMGTLVADIPFTIAVVLAASLIECFLVLPNHMRQSLAGSLRRAWYDWPSRSFNRGFDFFATRLFRPFVALTLRLRYPMLAAAILALAHAASLQISGRLPFIFFSAPEEGNVSGSFAMMPGASRAETASMVRELQRAVAAVAARYEAETGVNPVTFAMGQIGATAGTGLGDEEPKSPDELGGIAVELIDPDLRPWTSREFVARLEAEVERSPMLETLSFRSGRFGPGGSALEIRLAGADSATLKAAAEDLKARLEPFPIVSGLEDSLAWDKTEMVLALTPLGEALGFTIE
ncbi:MAG TPA: efflux RND transporter permease subunit, partial [Paracoccaceae bacterium]|nr:efflux RND transporter permease subunit [Paracoccaceae bacterium]